MMHRSRQDDLYAQAYHEGLRAARVEQQPALPPPVAPEWETFGQLLERLRDRLNLSRNRLAHEAGCDPSYLTRIEHEERDPPRRHLVDALARALFLNEFEYRQFVTAAGYAPVRKWTPELEAAYRARR